MAALFVGRHLRIMNKTESRVLLVVIAGLVILHSGCSRSMSPRINRSAVPAARTMSTDEAARLAARLANDQCERQYRERPFSPEHHSAILQDGTYRWGGLDVGGPKGFSALVVFGEDGTQPHVEVYFSSDALSPPRLPVAPPPDGAPKNR
jgi:hypothetical protein